MPGTLYIVATPIGHLDDITRRAVNVLCSVAIIAAEDSRRARILLNHLGASDRQVTSLHDHNEQAATEQLIGELLSDNDIALISDAGTPLVSDPGFELVRAARANEIPLVPVPGPSSITAALSACPIPARHFYFEGFLPAKREQRRERWQRLVRREEAVVFFEAPHRLLACLADLADIATGERSLFLGREMTKRHEEYVCASVSEQLARYEARPSVKGEFVGVLAGAEVAATSAEVDRVMRVLARELPPSTAAKLGAAITGAARGELYELARQLSNGSHKRR